MGNEVVVTVFLSINLILTDLESNPGPRGEIPAKLTA
jgi:hypothetical protein